MSRRNTSSKTNGHAGSHGRANGHASASTERGGVPLQREQAASVDDRRACVAGAAGSATAPGTDCKAYAEAAPTPPNGNVSAADRETTDRAAHEEPIPGGEFPLPADPGEFVEEIHRHADLFILWHKLLNSKDPKIQQRAVEKLTEMHYKGAAALADEPQQVVVDIPRPKRD